MTGCVKAERPTCLCHRHRERWFASAFRHCGNFRLYGLAIVWTAVIAAGILFGGLRLGFTFGGDDRFEPWHVVEGYGGFLRLLLGLRAA